VRNCNSGAGPSRQKEYEKLSYEELDVVLLQWLNQKEAETAVSISGPTCAKPTSFMKLWN
jgi:hypothetical protein